MNYFEQSEVFLNSIEQVRGTIKLMNNEINSYLSKPNPYQFYLDLKRKHVISLNQSLNNFIVVFNCFEKELTRLSLLIDKKEEELFRREACAFINGCSLFEIQSFINKPISLIINEVNEQIRNKEIETKRINSALSNGNLKKTNQTIFNWSEAIKQYRQQKTLNHV